MMITIIISCIDHHHHHHEYLRMALLKVMTFPTRIDAYEIHSVKPQLHHSFWFPYSSHLKNEPNRQPESTHDRLTLIGFSRLPTRTIITGTTATTATWTIELSYYSSNTNRLTFPLATTSFTTTTTSEIRTSEQRWFKSIKDTFQITQQTHQVWYRPWSTASLQWEC